MKYAITLAATLLVSVAVFAAPVPKPATPDPLGTPMAGVELVWPGVVPGVGIRRVVPGSGAFEAGVRGGDVIIKVGDTSCSDVELTIRGIKQYRPGAIVTLTVSRSGQSLEIPVRLGVVDAPQTSSP